ncbi:MAG: hypothetical protein FD162_2164 [Rhodobacteraceae bacterium]|nr:MAG: hypothetical protein FD162_2164 [Paracoccaceae bacterium]
MAVRGQLDLFDWGKPKQKFRRIGFQREQVVCKIGPHWWFAPYLVMGDDRGRVIPDLVASIAPRFYQFRA